MIANDQAGSAGQKRLVIVGASGMVGGYALRYALDNSEVKSVTSIGRKKLGISHPKLEQVLHQNFADCSALANVLSNQDAVVYCLGAYTGSVSDDQLRVITADYAIEFARVLRDSSPDAAFSFLSGSGADPTGQSRLAFARYKGQAEKALQEARLEFRDWRGRLEQAQADVERLLGECGQRRQIASFPCPLQVG